MATHSSVLAWRIPGTGEPSGLPSVGSHRVGHDKRLSSSSIDYLKKKRENNGVESLGMRQTDLEPFAKGLQCLHLDTPLFKPDTWRRQWQPTPVLLPGKSHGWRGLVGYSPWSCEESDTAEQLHFHFSLSCAGEGNGNPLQCSYLENPRNGGAWWAAVYGVAQSGTRLKRLSSSSRSLGWEAPLEKEMATHSSTLA